MAHEVKMPQMGESIAEGTLTTWLKKVGDTIAQDEPLFEIATDKVDAEIPSPVAGVLLAIHAAPGETVPIGTVVAVIGVEGEATAGASASKPAAAAPAPASKAPPVAANGGANKQLVAAVPAAAPKVATSSERPHKSSPLVRSMAKAHGVDLQHIQGTGLQQRITKEDMLNHLASVADSPAAQPSKQSRPEAQSQVGSTGAWSRLEQVWAPIPDAYRGKVMDGDKVEALTPMRSKIAEHMSLSKAISPHVATVWEMDLERLVQARKRSKQKWADQHGINLTYTTFILKALVDALRAFPQLNASLDGKQIIYHQHINMGLAVALDNGLLVPVIAGAEELSMLGIARKAQDLAQRARTKKLRPEELQGGTFTLTNPGNLGAMFNIPVINQPQVAILGVGTVEKRPVVIDDMIAIRTRSYMSLSFDHRLIDGAVADAFMAHIKAGLEQFESSEL